jgi:hypothetical protein
MHCHDGVTFSHVDKIRQNWRPQHSLARIRQTPVFIFSTSVSQHQHVVSLARSAIIDAALSSLFVPSSFLITPGSIVFCVLVRFLSLSFNFLVIDLVFLCPSALCSANHHLHPRHPNSLPATCVYLAGPLPSVEGCGPDHQHHQQT